MSSQDPDIRWKQRFSNYEKALAQLEKFISKKNLSQLEEQGLIKAFEYTYELAWKLIKDYYEYQGVTGIQGSRDAFRMAFQRGLINEGDTWMDMIESRKLTMHTYNEEVAGEIAEDVFNRYYPQFVELKTALNNLQEY